MSLIKKFEQSLVSLKQIRKGDLVVVAVSGGCDSVVLLHLLFELQNKWHFKLIVGHVNHHLRGEESNGDEQFVRSLAKKLHLFVEVLHVDVQTKAREKKTSIQNAARLLRYSCLEKLRMKHNANWIATAHHADDNAETILAHLFRGSGIEGLQGIHPIRNNIIRPMLFASRNEIDSYAYENNIKWCEDSSNATDHYTRNEIRHHIIPAITKRINPTLSSTLLHTSAIFQSLHTFIQHHIDALYSEVAQFNDDMLCLAIPTLKKYFDFEQIALIQRAIREFFGNESSFSEIIAVHGLLRAQIGKVVLLHNRGKVFRDRDAIVFRRSIESQHEVIHFSTGEIIPFDKYELKIEPVEKEKSSFDRNPYVEFIDKELVQSEWTLRRWHEGDWFIPLGLKGKQKVSDFLVNQKIPRWQKEKIYVLESDSRIVWICGKQLDNRFKITDATTSILQLSMVEKK